MGFASILEQIQSFHKTCIFPSIKLVRDSTTERPSSRLDGNPQDAIVTTGIALYVS